MPRTKARACGDKQKHNTIKEARAHKWSLINETGASPKSINVYRCKFCKKYHVGKKTPRKI